MFKQVLLFAAVLLLAGCASTSNIKKDETVTILVNNGDKIKAQILDISGGKIVFKAKSWEMAYEYGEIINVERINGIELADGMVLSVDEFEAYRKGVALKSSKETTSKEIEAAAVPNTDFEESADFQYEQLKNKPIAEMTDNEFKFFMMMKERELQSQERSQLDRIESPEMKGSDVNETEKQTFSVEQPVVSTPSIKKMESSETVVALPASSGDEQLREVVDSILEAGLAPTYLVYLQNKSQAGTALNTSESQMMNLIETNPKWRENLNELDYINRTAEKALARAYLYNPEDLKDKLNLNFDQNLEMDYFDLLGQLHRSLGEDVKMSDFRKLVDVLDESGAKAIKELLENYSNWQFWLNKSNSMTIK